MPLPVHASCVTTVCRCVEEHGLLGRSSNRRRRKRPFTRFSWRAWHTLADGNSIPKFLVYHADDTSVYLLAPSRTTVDRKGKRDVVVLHQDDKRAVTVMLGGCADGSLLQPFVIFDKVKRGLPEHPDVASSSSPTHWMTVDTAKEWIDTVVIPDASAKCRAHKLPILLVWDIAPWLQHHIGTRTSAKCLYPPPPGTTGFLQVCDVGLNRPFKQSMRDSHSAYFGESG